MINLIAVFLGGGLGSLCRYGLARGMNQAEQDFPYATLLANILSCIILGLLISLMAKPGLSNFQKLFFTMGFCGGFSTFSTFSNETFELFQSGSYTSAFLNIAGSLILCLFSIYLGMLSGKHLFN